METVDEDRFRPEIRNIELVVPTYRRGCGNDPVSPMGFYPIEQTPVRIEDEEDACLGIGDEDITDPVRYNPPW